MIELRIMGKEKTTNYSYLTVPFFPQSVSVTFREGGSPQCPQWWSVRGGMEFQRDVQWLRNLPSRSVNTGNWKSSSCSTILLISLCPSRLLMLNFYLLCEVLLHSEWFTLHIQLWSLIWPRLHMVPSPVNTMFLLCILSVMGLNNYNHITTDK